MSNLLIVCLWVLCGVIGYRIGPTKFDKDGALYGALIGFLAGLLGVIILMCLPTRKPEEPATPDEEVFEVPTCRAVYRKADGTKRRCTNLVAMGDRFCHSCEQKIMMARSASQ